MAEKKGLGALAWIGIGCGLLIVIVIVALVAGGLFVAHKAKEAGFDPQEWKDNPSVVITKMIAAGDPDIEIVDIDEENERVTLRNIESGKTFTVDFKDIKDGNFSLESEGETVRIETTGDGEGGGSMRVSGEDGEMVFGAGAERGDTPDWVPLYPGAEINSRFSSTTGGKKTGTLVQQTSDASEDVLAHFETALEQAGFGITAKSSAQVDGATHASLQGTDEQGGRTVFVGVNEGDGETMVTVRYEHGG